MKIFITIVFILAVLDINAQNDTINIYTNLDTKKYYYVSMSSQTKGMQPTKYKVNGNYVTKSEYEKFQNTNKSMTSCSPCVLQYYDINDLLLFEAVSYGECEVGDYKEFYPNGLVKVKGHFKENHSDNWNDFDCSIRDGLWFFYNEKSQIYKIQTWRDGKLIDQKPKK